jgi:hypothetical protein
MHKAIVTVRPAYGDPWDTTVEHPDQSTFMAMVVGTVCGATSWGSVVSNVEIVEGAWS